MIPRGLTSSVINRASPGDAYVRVRDSGLVAAVAQFLYDEAALLDEWRLDETPQRRRRHLGIVPRWRRLAGTWPSSPALRFDAKRKDSESWAPNQSAA